MLFHIMLYGRDAAPGRQPAGRDSLALKGGTAQGERTKGRL